MDPIKSIVAGIMEKMASGQGGTFAEIQAAWARISSDKVSRVVDLKEGRLTVAADSSMRLVRLNLNRESYLKELRREFPDIKKISFKVG